MSEMKCPNIKIYKCSDGFVTDNAQVAKSHEANIKSNKLICPFCQQELQEDVGYDGDYSCPNCRQPYFGSPELWQELIRTRKALDIARNGLEYIFGYEGVPEYVVKHIRQVLDQIKNETALEQKDK